MTRHSLRVSARLIAPCAVPLLSVGMALVPATAQAEDHIILGAGMAVAPAYQGADDYRVLPLPAIDIEQGWFFANFRNGIGVAPLRSETVTVGASVVFVQGYRRRDAPDGIGRLSDGVGGRIFANVRAGGFVGTVGTTKVISGGTEGLLADASISYPLAVSSRLLLIPTVGIGWADRKHNDRYFGVTGAQAAASGLPRFDAGAGFKDVSGTLTASYRLTDRISLSATGGVTSLLGEVKDSPIVAHDTRPFGLIALTYRM